MAWGRACAYVASHFLLEFAVLGDLVELLGLLFFGAVPDCASYEMLEIHILISTRSFMTFKRLGRLTLAISGRKAGRRKRDGHTRACKLNRKSSRSIQYAKMSLSGFVSRMTDGRQLRNGRRDQAREDPVGRSVRWSWRGTWPDRRIPSLQIGG